MVEWHSFGRFFLSTDWRNAEKTSMRKRLWNEKNKKWRKQNLRDQFDLAKAAYKFSNIFESFYPFTDGENQIVLWAVNFSQV